MSERVRLWFNKPWMIIARNIIWIILGPGFVVFLLYLIGGLFLAITIVGIPWAVRVWQMSRYIIWPAGLEIRRTEETPVKALYIFLIVWWLIFIGIALIVIHISLGIALLFTIIGIPAAIEHFKLLQIAWNPLGITMQPTEWASRSSHETGRTPPVMT
ncbi:hypothetical protein P9112_014181 [Eukaryota sp. TZLM1-RC]